MRQAYWRRAEKRRQFRAGSGLRGGLGEVLGRANWVESPSSARAEDVEWLSTAGSGAASAIKRVRRGVDVGRKHSDLGRRRPFQPRPRCSPQLGTRRWPGAAQGRTFRTSALENEGRGLDRRSEGSAAPGESGGRVGLPKPSDRLPQKRRAKTPFQRVRPGAELFGGLVFHAIAVSSNHDHLPVMHQPVDHGGR